MSSTDVDLSEFGAYEKEGSHALPCPVKGALTSLSGAALKKFMAALDAPQTGEGRISNAAISRWLEDKHKIKVRWQAVRGHRAQICTCHKAHA